MIYITGMGSVMNDLFDASAENESLYLSSGDFVAKNCKTLKIASIIGSILSTVGGILIFFFLNEEIAILFLVLGICMLLLLPTILSYRCLVNKTFMKEEYFVLFFRLKKEIHWSDVKFKKVITGRNSCIKLYDKNKKRLISFDSSTVGYNRIVKLAKRMWIIELEK